MAFFLSRFLTFSRWVKAALIGVALASGFCFGNFSWAIEDSPLDQEYLSAVKAVHQRHLSPAKLVVLKEGQVAEVLTWTTDKYEPGPQPALTQEIWVVDAAQMKGRCPDLFASGGDPTERINQLLGMPPSAPQHFELIKVPVTPYIFVKNKLKAEIIRPCFSSGDVSRESCHYLGKGAPEDSLSPYQQWIKSIDTETGSYPWTGLGYTYDWSPTNPSHVGLSEFILPVGSQVVVEKSVTPQEFCEENH